MAEIKCIYVKTSKEGFLCASTLLIRSIPCSHWAGSMENAQLLLGQWLPILLAGQNPLENFLFYFILGLCLLHMGVPRLGVESKL